MVTIGMHGGVITSNTMASGARFDFACIGDTKDYFSSTVTETENYPNQSMVPPYYYGHKLSTS
jgi:hypothetical protein